MENKTFDFGKTSQNQYETIKQELLVSGDKAVMTYTNKFDKKCSMTISVETNEYNKPVVVFYGLKYKYERDFFQTFNNKYGSNQLKRID
jgi:hypothetical protein